MKYALILLISRWLDTMYILPRSFYWHQCDAVKSFHSLSGKIKRQVAAKQSGPREIMVINNVETEKIARIRNAPGTKCKRILFITASVNVWWMHRWLWTYSIFHMDMRLKSNEYKCTYGALNHLSGNFTSLHFIATGPISRQALLTYFIIIELTFDFDDCAFLHWNKMYRMKINQIKCIN